MVCKYCGAEVPDGSTKCDYCGETLLDNNSQSNSTTSNYQQANGGYSYNPSQTGYSANYQNQGGYNNYQNSNVNNNEGTGTLGIVSLVLGILSIISCCSGWVSLLFGIIAIVLACVEKKKSGIRTAGLITGIIGTLICLIVVCIMIVGQNWFEENADEFMKAFEEGFTEGLENSEEFQDLKNEYENKYDFKDYDFEKSTSDTSTNTNEIQETKSMSKDDWAIKTMKDGVYVCTYANGIPDDYMLSDKGSFKNVSEWLEFAIPGYPIETFRQVVSVYCLNSDSYKAIIKKSNDDEVRNYTLSLFASLAWQINNDFGGKVTAAEISPDSLNVIKFIINSDINNGTVVELVWDSSNNTTKFRKQGDEKYIDYVTTAFTSDRLGPMMVAIEEALKGEKAG